MPSDKDAIRRQDEIIDRVGWMVMLVLPGEEQAALTASYAYTVGLAAHHFPELLIVGLDPHVAHELLNDLAKRVWYRAERFSHGTRIGDLIAGYDAVIIDAQPTRAIAPDAAIARYGADRVRVQQVVWSDQQRRFPWDPGYEFTPDVQPLIGRP